MFKVVLSWIFMFFHGDLPSLTILWLALPLIWLAVHVSGGVNGILEGSHSRGESYTARVFLIFGVIQTLPLGQSIGPAIALLGLILRILMRRLVA